MRTWLLCVLALACGLQAAQCCSCVEDAFRRTRTAAIKDDYCYSSMVYSARVVGANCNCRMGNTTLKCVNYTRGEDWPHSSQVQKAQVMTIGECEMASFIAYDHTMCADLSSALNVSANITQPDDLPTVNLTAMAENGRCPNVCPFNMMDDDDVFNIESMANPCWYTLELLEVFKPVNTSLGSTIMSFGPDVLTTCGNPTRRLSIGEMYLVGVGGACNPISEWSTLESYSDSELDFLRELRRGVVCGALGLVPSLLTLILATLAVMLF